MTKKVTLKYSLSFLQNDICDIYIHQVTNVTFNFYRWPELKWVTVDDLSEVTSVDKKLTSGSVADDLYEAEVSPSDLAFLQYTSGSTSEPKGVMITQANLSHNLSSIIHELKADTSTVVVSWLPQ
jgi:long-subunit acyl-CoA synthetase (AMP-forming)